MTGLPSGADEALAPTRGALLAGAGARADAIRQDARDEASALLAAARAEAERVVAAAVAEGEASARADAALRSARARRQAQGTVLASRESLRRQLHDEVRGAAVGLRHDAVYPMLLETLTAECRAVLGPGASVEEHPDGGVVARAGSRTLDLSLPSLAERALAAMGPEVSRLWTP